MLGRSRLLDRTIDKSKQISFLDCGLSNTHHGALKEHADGDSASQKQDLGDTVLAKEDRLDQCHLPHCVASVGSIPSFVHTSTTQHLPVIGVLLLLYRNQCHGWISQTVVSHFLLRIMASPPDIRTRGCCSIPTLDQMVGNEAPCPSSLHRHEQRSICRSSRILACSYGLARL